MDQGQFSTTFIPKKPMVAAPQSGAPISRPSGFLTAISTLLFFLTILIAGGIYFWQQYETANVAKLAASVAKVEKSFEPELIAKWQSLDQQLKNADTVLKSHTVLSPVFAVLESSTLKRVRFNRFDGSFDQAGAFSVKMAGEADGYQAIAQQSDLLGSNTFIQNILFSNFSLNQKGKVSFDLSFGVEDGLIDFEKAPIASQPTL